MALDISFSWWRGGGRLHATLAQMHFASTGGNYN